VNPFDAAVVVPLQMSNEREMADELLMGYLAAGHSEYVGTLIRRHGGPLTAFLRRTAPCLADADDIFQEVWLRVVRSARAYDPEQRFTAWLFTIAWNQVRNHWRRHKEQQATRTDEGTDRLQDARCPGPGADQRLLDAERSDRLRRLIGLLPERLAEAVCLRYFEELSEKEIALRLGVPVGTVKSRLHHGIKKLAPLVRGEP
jgi:RNA polymerase sigma-70 factor, ECF subfamily